MPKIDIDKLLAEDEKDNELGLPFRFGYGFDVDYNLYNSGIWTEIQSGRVWKLKIVSDGAYSINLAYDKFHLPENSELYIYNEDKTILQGPITSKNNTPNKQFSSDLIEGSAIILEYFEPIEVKGKGAVSISKVVHAYRNLFSDPTKGFGSSGSCNIDINCPEGQDWQAESNSVAMILVGDTRICSGALINNTCQDFIPYFLTANHCIQGQNVGNWTFRFQYKSPSCGGGDDYYSYYSYYGASLKANSSISDFALLELNQRPAGNTYITYAGWSNQNIASPAGVSITHPRGDVMKIALYNQTITQQTYLGSYDWNVSWAQGTVEPGSSGGPLFNNSHQIIGQVHGGNPADICTANDHAFFGRFDISWTNGLSNFLDPNNTGAITTNTVPIPYITGPSTVCSSGSSFSVDKPDGYTISWEKSSNLSRSSSQGSNPCAFTANGSGEGWIEATINSTSCGSITLPRKEVWVGKPTNDEIDFGVYFTSEPHDQVPIMEPVAIGIFNNPDASDQSVTSYTWQFGGWSSYVTHYGDHVGVSNDVAYLQLDNYAPSTQIVLVSAENACGYDWIMAKGKMFYAIDNYYYMSVSPNPATDYVEVNFYEGEELHATDKNSKVALKPDKTQKDKELAYEVQLWNEQGMLLKQKSNQKKLQLQTAGLKTGTYFLHVLINGETYKQQIVVTH